MNDKSIHEIVKRFMKRRPFKQVKTIEEADSFLIFHPDEIEKFTIKLKKDKEIYNPPPNYKIFYFKSTRRQPHIIRIYETNIEDIIVRIYTTKKFLII